jgi:transposase
MARPSSRTKDVGDLIQHLWFTNASIKEISKQTDTTITSIRRWAADLGLPAKRSREAYTPHPLTISNELEDKIFEKYTGSTKKNAQRLGEELNVSTATVIKVLQKRKINTARCQVNENDLVNEYLKCRSISVCERKFNMGWNTVKKILEAHDVDLNQPKYDWQEYDDKLRQVCQSTEATNYSIISELVGLPTHQTTQRIRELGIETPYRLYKSIDEFSEVDIQEIRRLYLTGVSKKELCSSYPVPWRVYDEIIKDCMYNRSIAVPPERHHEFLAYAKTVRQVTKFIRNRCNMDSCEGMDWDHRLSVVDCFLNDVPVDVAGGRENLELITSVENNQKSHRSSITVDELYRLRGQR